MKLKKKKVVKKSVSKRFVQQKVFSMIRWIIKSVKQRKLS